MPDKDPKQEPIGADRLLLDLADKAVGKAEESGSSLPVYVFFAALAAVCFAIVGFMAISARRRAARLEYELRVKAEEHKRATEQALLEMDAAKREEAVKKANELAAGVERLKKEVLANGQSAAARKSALDQATSWDDLVIVDKRK